MRRISINDDVYLVPESKAQEYFDYWLWEEENVNGLNKWIDYIISNCRKVCHLDFMVRTD